MKMVRDKFISFGILIRTLERMLRCWRFDPISTAVTWRSQTGAGQSHGLQITGARTNGLRPAPATGGETHATVRAKPTAAGSTGVALSGKRTTTGGLARSTTSGWATEQPTVSNLDCISMSGQLPIGNAASAAHQSGLSSLGLTKIY